MEQQFNIGNVIEHYKLNTEDLAKVLFPTVKYPKQAFDRVLKGEAQFGCYTVRAIGQLYWRVSN